jgi:3-oxoacyl-[acyl-carrier-protein] synthase-3
MNAKTKILTENGQKCLQQLMRTWFDFERDLGRVSIISRLESGHFSKEDYLNLLLHLRQQVIEGGRWITRCASSFDRDFIDVRNIVIQHAKDEHQDYRVLESDYTNAGGDIEMLHQQERNIGTEALHAFLMHQASLPNPIDLIGAMWMIEGLGQKMAGSWADRIDEVVGKERKCTQFMHYHAENDDDHIEKLYQMIDRVCVTGGDIKRIVKTARVVGKLYAMQLEEIDYV